MKPDAGFSVLELIVTLGIMAGLAVVVAASLPRAPADAITDAAAILSFVAEARTEVILTGEAGVLTIGQHSMSFGDKQIQWGPEFAVTTGAATSPASYRLLLDPDGSYSGATLYVRSPGTALAIPGIYRFNPADG
ncbi:hypothetical protein VW23_014365 [Devosia insulae DS-56]|uniref:Type II secretion system protein GspH n=1 Tax=Devosia insulae DS-56 TaxID=1116389 RepID=A0A1E5XTD7_9HYPH|nr:hypothetical protein [Devosia insulae]OEO31857.1 hypothetical protein VW23_014365 [Devosia insulae DS-56]